jgi:uncharacterized membrane protein YeaQ/YmgE (transglycosylase-associated protein family)
MHLIMWLIVGGLIGWLASIIMKTTRQSVLTNIVVGVVGTFLGGQMISPMVGVGSISSGISIRSILVSLFGAIVLLGVINLVRLGRVR